MFTDTKSVNKLLQEIKILKWKDQREFPLLNKIFAIKNELVTLLVGMQTSTATMENSVEIS